MNFTETNKPAMEVALHYAKKLDNTFAADVIAGKKEISSKEEAIAFTAFFWEMTDESVKCSGLIASDTLIRDNSSQTLRCHYESEKTI